MQLPGPGSRGYAANCIPSLGTFEVDGHEQQRWTLKVADPTLLRSMDSVIVTAEALGDAKEPHGGKLLYAYMVGQRHWAQCAGTGGTLRMEKCHRTVREASSENRFETGSFGWLRALASGK